MGAFRQFILEEQRAYLGQKVGDILTAAQELRDDSMNMGTRDLVRFSERLVNQIRRILHSQWPREEKKFLKDLQKIGVSIMKAVDEKDDLTNVISSAVGGLEKLSGKLGVPIHKMASPDTSDTEDDDMGISGPATKKKKSQTMPGAPNQSSAPPPPPGGPPPDAQPPLGGNAGPLQAF
jgi:hypothetical protein